LYFQGYLSLKCLFALLFLLVDVSAIIHFNSTIIIMIQKLNFPQVII
jgi:hypothetical protein